MDPGAFDPDLDLLRGVRFRCRPECGLCCFAEPRADPPERARLLQIAPEATFVGRGPDRFLAARPDGGACQFLSELRCRVHSARPHPCREFPVTVHLGHRVQATLVLSCPGVELGPLLGGPGAAGAGPQGLESELASVRERLGPEVDRRVAITSRRGRRIERWLRVSDRWWDDDEVRALLTARVPLPDDRDFPAEDPPGLDAGIELLPIFFDGRPGPVALARDLGGWRVLEVAPAGGYATLGVVPPPTRAPRLEAGAEALLGGYLRYVLCRDAFLAAVHLDALEEDEGSVLDWAEAALRALGADVLARAAVRAKLRGAGERALTAADVEDGIRATDLDSLDRPTWGDRL